MTGLDIFALIVLAILAATVLGVLMFLAQWPGKIAQSRGHAQTDAIRVTGWLGILTFGILWPLAFVWAHTNPSEEAVK
jgi:hypothetical protein